MGKTGARSALQSESARRSTSPKAGRKSRPVPSLEWEVRSGYPALCLAGVDEVGRGCLAGPVVAGAVLLPSINDMSQTPWLAEVTDSKLLSPEARERLAPLIESWAAASAIGVATVEEIDRLNIYHASHLAMRRAIENLNKRPQHILVDGKFLPAGLPCPGTAVVKGDLKCLSVAAGSIIAKVWRDRYMVGLHASYPHYGFAAHKGYSTSVHAAALKKQGACPEHRRSFAPVAEVLGAGARIALPAS